ncbi:unnamed protein product, partial [Ectocarpus fasciculatus]
FLFLHLLLQASWELVDDAPHTRWRGLRRRWPPRLLLLLLLLLRRRNRGSGCCRRCPRRHGPVLLHHHPARALPNRVFEGDKLSRFRLQLSIEGDPRGLIELLDGLLLVQAPRRPGGSVPRLSPKDSPGRGGSHVVRACRCSCFF